MESVRYDESAARGLSRAHLRSGAWRHPAHNVYQPAQLSGLLERCRAVQLILDPDAVFTHLTSAALRGWWLPDVDWPHLIACSEGEAPHHDRQGVYVRRCDVPLGHRSTMFGVRIASGAWTIAELAEHLALVDLVVAIDCALHLGDCTLAELRDVVIPGRRGVRTLRRALALCDGRSESAWETILRLLHVLSGIAAVEPQYVVSDPAGTFLARADLRLGRTQRLVEYDGADHLDKLQQRRDLKRDKGLRRWQWDRYGYVATEIHRQPHMIVRDAESALGIPHDPSRVSGWLTEYALSSLTPAGRAALRQRLDRFVRTTPPRRARSDD